MRAIMETSFDVVYLITAITIGIYMISKGSKSDKEYKLFGIMAVTLGCGDAFHLVPRAIALCTVGLEHYTVPLGIGKLITSVTMTIFYILLYHVWRKRYNIKGQQTLTYAVYIMAIARVILCLFPICNTWTYRYCYILQKRKSSWRQSVQIYVAYNRAKLWILHPCCPMGRKNPSNRHAYDT